MFDISTISTADLRLILEKIPAELKRREVEDKKRLRKELEELAAKSGYTLDQLLGEAAEKVAKVRKPVEIKYRHPDDPTLVSSGRGKPKKWITEFLANGGTLEQLAV